MHMYTCICVYIVYSEGIFITYAVFLYLVLPHQHRHPWSCSPQGAHGNVFGCALPHVAHARAIWTHTHN